MLLLVLLLLLLCQVDWWRLVFDEAQQVGSLSNTAVMAGYLQAKHRWVVTGTPIGAGE
jgi:SNF2 family DNA or RNA helicase